jgi:hypothetical protein
MDLSWFVCITVGHELGHDVDGHGEDDGTVVLGRYAVQSLQVPQLTKQNISSIYV